MKLKLLSVSAIKGIFLIAIAAVAMPANAQTTVTVNAGATWNGYMNVFDTSNNYQFGSAWGLPDVKTTFDTALNTVTLYPNYNTYAAGDAYWSNGAAGNKIMEGNTYVESTTITGTLTFTGTVVTKTLASQYNAVAFIKGLNPATGYSLDVFQSAPLVAGETFSVTATNIPAGLIVQYGFSVTGINANPITETTNGNVVVTATALGISEVKDSKVSLFPNPAHNMLTIQSGVNVAKVEVMNTLGQTVLSSTSLNNGTLDVSALTNGMYILHVTSEAGTSAYKFLKN